MFDRQRKLCKNKKIKIESNRIFHGLDNTYCLKLPGNTIFPGIYIYIFFNIYFQRALGMKLHFWLNTVVIIYIYSKIYFALEEYISRWGYFRPQGAAARYTLYSRVYRKSLKSLLKINTFRKEKNSKKVCRKFWMDC